MARETDKFKIGLFVIITISIMIILIVWLGATKYLQRHEYYVTYFDESVSGLDLGSSVSFRGVQVGQVSNIDIAPDGKLIEVQMKIRPGLYIPPDYYATLELRGITGLWVIKIDKIRPSKLIKPVTYSFKTSLPVIPSYPSGAVQLDVAFNRIYESVTAVDTKAISEGLVNILKTIDSMLAKSPVNAILCQIQKQVPQLLETMGTILKKLNEFNIEETNTRIITVLDKYGNVADSMRLFIPQLIVTMRDLQFMTQTTQRDLHFNSQDFSESMRSVKHFVDYLETNPAALIRGRKVEKLEFKK